MSSSMMRDAMLITLILSIFGGCVADKHRVDPGSVHLSNVYWGSEDLKEIASVAVGSLLKAPYLQDQKIKVLAFLKIKNNTFDHIDTVSLTESIKAGLLQSKKVRFIDFSRRKELHRYLVFQRRHKKHYGKIKQMGKELSLDGFIYSNISAIYQTNDQTKDMTFNFILNLVDIETAQIVWSDTVTIRKISKKKLLGL